LDLRRNIFSGKGIDWLANAAKQVPVLIGLRLEGNEDKTSTPAVKKMEFHLRHHKQNVENKALRQQIREVFQSSASIENCSFEYMRLSIPDADAIAKALVFNVSTVSLRLRDNALPVEGFKRVTKALQKNQTIRTLSIVDNNIGDTGMKALVILLRKSNSLRKVAIANTVQLNELNGLKPFTHLTCSRLCRVLANYTSLTSLTLVNCGLDDDRLGAIVPAIAWRGTMEYLDLRGNPYTDHSAYVFPQVVRRCSRLYHLDVVSHLSIVLRIVKPAVSFPLTRFYDKQSYSHMSLRGVQPLVEEASKHDRLEVLLIGRFESFDPVIFGMYESLEKSASLIRLELVAKPKASKCHEPLERLKVKTMDRNRSRQKAMEQQRQIEQESDVKYIRKVGVVRRAVQEAMELVMVPSRFYSRMELKRMRREDRNAW
jgi:hypothetical protein